MLFNYKGKNYKVPDAEIDKLKSSLSCTSQEAFEVWLCDNEIETNDEQTALDKVAKSQTVEVGNARSRKKSTEPRKDTTSDVKKQLFAYILAQLSENYTVDVLNDNKLIEITVDNRTFKLNLSENRVKK